MSQKNNSKPKPKTKTTAKSKPTTASKKSPRSEASVRKNSSTRIADKKKPTKAKVKASPVEVNDGQILDLYRRWGHLKSDIDPIGNLQPFPYAPFDALDRSKYSSLEKAYCSKIGLEFMHMPYPEKCDWLAEKMENGTFEFDARKVLTRILSVETFEKFLHTKYVGAKRFSLEGLAAIVPLLDSILNEAAEAGVEDVIIGMAHRGRLNVMHHIVDTLAEHIVANFEDVDPRSALGGDDVKYHKGATGIYKTTSGKELRVELAANPSHLEAVNPVVMGKTRARQEKLGDEKGEKVLCLILHGDAAFSGQGVAAETLNYATIPGFTVGGAINIVLNNLIGFTATQPALFSGRYCTDIAKRLDAPIFHVNADSPADVIKVGQIAANYRSEFKNDVFIDLVGYRRFGHNEVDDPTLTSPALYKQIKERPVLFKLYASEIGVSDQNVEQLEQGAFALFEEGLKKGRELTKKPNLEKLSSPWDNYPGGLYKKSYELPTSISSATAKKVSAAICSTPEDFNLHPKLGKLLGQRAEMIEGKRGVDWGCAEALAFGSLLDEEIPIRLVGQDCRRGTFTHRQAVLYDYNDSSPYTPLSKLEKNGSSITIYDSMLSEAAAVGFEYGYTREIPDALVLWEAQFGDFVNGAQIIIDQFISAGEDKWGLLSGLVMLLPHGYEGAGPEHSSARLERFLQLCAEDNMQVCQPSTSAQYFHLLRRQAKRVWKKPLIVITPKGMLRLPAASSSIDKFTAGKFDLVLDELNEEFDNATRMILCSGKVIHELRSERAKRNDTKTAIVAIEQFYPTPEKELKAVLKKYSKIKSLIWVQDEPANMGGLSFIRPILDRVAGGLPIYSVKRSSSASPATGSPKAHLMEQQALMNMSFTVGVKG